MALFFVFLFLLFVTDISSERGDDRHHKPKLAAREHKCYVRSLISSPKFRLSAHRPAQKCINFAVFILSVNTII